MRSVYKILVWKPQMMKAFEYVFCYRGIKLKWSLKKWDVRMQTGLKWLWNQSWA
jgi:hypothetical protein